MTRINITDDMIERAAKAAYAGLFSLVKWEDIDPQDKWFRLGQARVALEAALDRRTGPKDRRVEYEDVEYTNARRGTLAGGGHNPTGRRKHDKSFLDLPRKSDRLKREAEEARKFSFDAAIAAAKRGHHEVGEIKVSECATEAGCEALRRARGCSFLLGYESLDKYVVRSIFRAMRLQEMKERGQ